MAKNKFLLNEYLGIYIWKIPDSFFLFSEKKKFIQNETKLENFQTFIVVDLMMHRVIGDPILIPMKKLCTETRKLHKGNDIRVRGVI